MTTFIFFAALGHSLIHALGIKVAIELPVMIESGKKRKKYIEGFENESYVKEIISKLSHNGIAVDYFVMDEPLYFGAYRGRNKTAMTAEEAVEYFFLFFPDSIITGSSIATFIPNACKVLNFSFKIDILVL